MPAQVAWISGTAILEFVFADPLSIDEYTACVTEGRRLIDQRPFSQFHVLADARQLNHLPYQLFQVTKSSFMGPSRVQHVAIVGAQAYLRLLVNLAVRAIVRREVPISFYDHREMAIAALEALDDAALPPQSAAS